MPRPLRRARPRAREYSMQARSRRDSLILQTNRNTSRLDPFGNRFKETLDPGVRTKPDYLFAIRVFLNQFKHFRPCSLRVIPNPEQELEVELLAASFGHVRPASVSVG